MGMLRKYSTMGYTFSLSSLCSVFLVLGIELSTSPTVCPTTETYHQPSSVSNSSPHQLFIYLFYKLFSVICMDILAACMHVHHTYTRCPQRPEENSSSLRTGAIDGCEPLHGAGDQTWVLCNISQYAKHGATSLAPQVLSFSFTSVLLAYPGYLNLVSSGDRSV